MSDTCAGRTVTFSCRQDNDLYRVLADAGHTCARVDTVAEALEAAAPGTGILALADAYPRPDCRFDGSLAHRVADKGLRLYLEYPASLPGIVLGEPRPTQWERVVVSSDFFAPHLAPLTILAQHGCWFLPTGTSASGVSGAPEGPGGRPGERDRDAPHRATTQLSMTQETPLFAGLAQGTEVHLTVARVAGYDRAVFGLPETAFPILFQLPDCDILVATTKLSGFVRGRYGPQRAWKSIWEGLLHWLAPSAPPSDLAWTPTVRVQAGPDTPQANDAEAQALCRSVRWFREHVVYSIDWKKGAIEGFESAIDHDGRQMRRTWPRGDCTAESAMVFACDWARTRNPASRLLATQMLDYVWSSPDFCHDDPDDPAYGLNNWYERGAVFYGDDNARVIMPSLAAGALLQDDRWDERVLRCLLANLRTTGALGFRRNRLDLHHLREQERGWRFFCEEETVSYAPHYQAYLWAAYLLGYALTGYDGFLNKTQTALRTTMDVYPQWRWTNGITQEMARMLLPLAFLVRIENTAEHRGWLHRIADDLLAQMQPSGAIRERLGPLETGSYAPPQSNEAYGTSEASLIQENGDPACDLLYTTNFAFLGLHEAALATGDSSLRQATDRLAAFLCRIQVRSESHPYLDGAWMRSFDDTRWEYWGSSADLGWGAWSVESGWTNAWIAAVLAMRSAGSSLFDVTAASRPKSLVSRLLEEMLGAHPGA